MRIRSEEWGRKSDSRPRRVHERLAAIEVKLSSHATVADAAGILARRRTLKRRTTAELPGIVLHGGDGIHPLADHIYALPWRWLFPPLPH